jgi:hypothetical protein
VQKGRVRVKLAIKKLITCRSVPELIRWPSRRKELRCDETWDARSWESCGEGAVHVLICGPGGEWSAP